MKLALAQLNPIIGDINANKELIVRSYKELIADADLVIFSECAISGYPPMDLLTYDHFLNQIHEALNEIKLVTSHYKNKAICIGTPFLMNQSLKNAACIYMNGELVFQQFKTNLPNYDVFDERRYFDVGTDIKPFEFMGKRLGITVCEDAWVHDTHAMHYAHNYSENPIANLASQDIDLIINLSASPYEMNKEVQRKELFSMHAFKHKLPIILVNQVGANDQIIFDGASFVMNHQGQIVHQLEHFQEDTCIIDYDQINHQKEVTQTLDKIQCLHDALVLGIRDYVKKTGFKKVHLGLSGGIDSAVCCALAVKALGPDCVTGYALPSMYSSQGSLDDAEVLAKNLNISFKTIGINKGFDAIETSLKDEFKATNPDVTEENIQSRIRGILLMAISNKHHSLLLTTGNKSELAMGYCTLYGDMCGALSVLADVPKTTVYECAEYINKETEIIPKNSIEKPPSAELRPGQKDEDTLPPYDVLDKIIHDFVEENKTIDDIVKSGLDRELVTNIIKKINQNEYKRQQSPTPLKVSSKAFGRGRRMPIASRFFC